MIDRKCLTREWVAKPRLAMANASEMTIERSIRALVILERLAVSGLRFVFKGGSCMMLHLPALRRLSEDIDIVCTDPAGTVTPVLSDIARQVPFRRWDEDERNPDRRPKRKHYRFYYESLDAGNPKPFVLLDIVREHVPHPLSERKPVAASFVGTVIRRRSRFRLSTDFWATNSQPLRRRQSASSIVQT